MMEWQILELLRSGYTTREVANILDVSFHVVLKVETENEIKQINEIN